MTNHHYQHGFLEYERLPLNLVDADLEYRPAFFEASVAWELFEKIMDQTDWRQETIRVYGKNHLTPRLSCWMGDKNTDYRYSNMTMKSVTWNPTLLQVKRSLEEASGERFNSVLINYYRDGQDSNGWHSDDEPELGADPVIASISLGASRDFKLRHKTIKSLKHTILLEHGSLLLMRGPTQRCWQHQIPKRANVGARLNLTFRMIKTF